MQFANRYRQFLGFADSHKKPITGLTDRYLESRDNSISVTLTYNLRDLLQDDRNQYQQHISDRQFQAQVQTYPEKANDKDWTQYSRNI
jgi:esterase/lipase superfamily enzyme